MFFWNSLAFLMTQQMLAIWSLVPLPYLKPAWTSGSSRFTYCWSLLENFEHYFTSVWDECNCVVLWAFSGIAFLWGCNENWPFQSCGHCYFANLLAYWVHHFNNIIFWNSSTGIPSLLLALFVVMLPEAHLTLDSRISGSRWVITPSWLSGSWRSFLYIVLLCIFATSS